MSSVDPQGYGKEEAFVFSKMTESQIKLCKRLDEISKSHGLEMMPSKMFEGAICASDSRLRHNSDWLSQAANSLREILYPFYSRERKGLSKKNLIEDSVIKNRNFENEIGRIYNLLNGLAHHGNSDKSKLSKKDIEQIDFDELIADFEMIMREALKRQSDIYKDIENLIKGGIKNAKKKDALDLISSNPDAKDYFFSKVPIKWISWLKQNGFFDILNKEAEDKTRYSFKMPELGYLSRVVDSAGDEEEVISIINSVDCVENFNPEVVEQFIWIAHKLSTKSLVKMVPKIQKENWIELMKKFNPSGHTYELIVKKLTEAKEYKSLVILAKSLLILSTEKSETTYFDNYFLINDIGSSEIFDALAGMEDEYAEQVIELILSILTSFSKKSTEKSEVPFTHISKFSLYDVDLFTISVKHQYWSSDREDIKSLVAVLVKLIKNRFGGYCDKDARKIYDKYFSALPNSHCMWRMQIFAMHFCPELFKADLKKELNRFFDTKNYYHRYGISIFSSAPFRIARHNKSSVCLCPHGDFSLSTLHFI